MTASSKSWRSLTSPGDDVAQDPSASPSSWILTALVLLVMIIAITLRQGHRAFPGATLMVFTALSWAPLLLRMRAPLLVLGAVVVVESLNLIFVPVLVPDLQSPIPVAAYQPVPLATMAAAWTVACGRRRNWPFGVGAALLLLAVSLIARPLVLWGTDLVLFNLVCLATGIGTALAVRRDRAARARRAHERAVQDSIIGERLRIARDLHDVLAHRLALVNAQAGIASYLVKTNAAAAEIALDNITDHTGQALDELRATVGLLRRDTDPHDVANGTEAPREPTPGLAQLDLLVSRFAAAGTAIQRHTAGQPNPLSPSVDLAAYRIIQESLTNAAKHAPGAHVHLNLVWEPTQLRIDVDNEPTAAVPNLSTGRRGGGNGLIGMRERVRAVGGHLDLGPTPAHGFRVQAALPVHPASAAGPAT